jgi:quinol monooxygenase YgiN
MTANSPTALHHVVLFAFKDDASFEQIDAIVTGFSELPRAIPGILSYEWGTNVSPEGLNDGFTHCFTLTFASNEDRDIYLDHPAHMAFVATLKTCLARSLVVDYWARQANR